METTKEVFEDRQYKGDVKYKNAGSIFRPNYKYYRKWYDRVYDVKTYRDDTTDFYENGDVKRELRRIKVVGGYRIDNTVEIEKCRDVSGDTANILPFRKLINSNTVPIYYYDENGKKTDTGTSSQIDGYDSVNDVQMKKYNGSLSSEKGSVILVGTWDAPIAINGPVVFEGDVLIRGFVTGRGTIYSGRNIHIIGDINYKNPPSWMHDGSGTEPDNRGKDLLVLVSRGNIVIGNYALKYGGSPTNAKDWLDYNVNARQSDWKEVYEYIKGPNGSMKYTDDKGSHPYVLHDYTRIDAYTRLSESTFRKVEWKSDKDGHHVLQNSTTEALPYESVLGEYVFEHAELFNLASDTSRITERCKSRLLATWDHNAMYGSSLFGLPAQTGAFKSNYGDNIACTYLSDAIENYLNENDRRNANKPFRDFMSDFGDYCASSVLSHKYAFPPEYLLSGVGRPQLNCIRKINAVLYSSQGIFGAFGGKGGERNYATVNGAVLGCDICLVPFATRFLECYLTINWDMRLLADSADVEKEKRMNGMNNSNDDFGVGEIVEKTAEPGSPRTVSWQEVPESFNRAY